MADKEFNKIVPIANRFIQGKPTDTASARALHAKLKVKRDFSTWIKARIKEYDFQENQDFIRIFPKAGENSGRGRKLINYFS